MWYQILEILSISTVISLWVNAVIIVTDEDQLFHFVYRLMADDLRLPDWAMKPLLICPQCMCGVHGLVVYFLLYTLFPYGFSFIAMFISIVAAIPIAYYIRKKIIGF